jgi:hypothetical protein
MKNVMNLCLLMMFLIILDGCSVSEEGLAQSQESSKPSQIDSQRNTPMKQDDKILSRDLSIAENALNKAILGKDKDTIKLGLKNPVFTIRQKTVEAIAELKDESFVPELVEALQENQGLIAGGSEAQIMQDDLNQSIVYAISRLTRQKFKLSNPISSQEIKEVLDKSQNWCKFHKKDT